MYLNLAGRYSAFSGIEFIWDTSRRPGSRILVDTIILQDKKIDLNRIYKIAIHSFTGEGGDGFECFKQC
jgi:2',3'-cyclic-nucleotide 2'-phosphodiesterase (5'-nucleotidase family)